MLLFTPLVFALSLIGANSDNLEPSPETLQYEQLVKAHGQNYLPVLADDSKTFSERIDFYKNENTYESLESYLKDTIRVEVEKIKNYLRSDDHFFGPSPFQISDSSIALLHFHKDYLETHSKDLAAGQKTGIAFSLTSAIVGMQALFLHSITNAYEASVPKSLMGAGSVVGAAIGATFINKFGIFKRDSRLLERLQIQLGIIEKYFWDELEREGISFPDRSRRYEALLSLMNGSYTENYILSSPGLLDIYRQSLMEASLEVLKHRHRVNPHVLDSVVQLRHWLAELAVPDTAKERNEFFKKLNGAASLLKRIYHNEGGIQIKIPTASEATQYQFKNHAFNHLAQFSKSEDREAKALAEARALRKQEETNRLVAEAHRALLEFEAVSKTQTFDEDPDFEPKLEERFRRVLGHLGSLKENLSSENFQLLTDRVSRELKLVYNAIIRGTLRASGDRGSKIDQRSLDAINHLLLPMIVVVDELREDKMLTTDVLENFDRKLVVAGAKAKSPESVEYASEPVLSNADQPLAFASLFPENLRPYAYAPVAKKRIASFLIDLQNLRQPVSKAIHREFQKEIVKELITLKEIVSEIGRTAGDEAYGSVEGLFKELVQNIRTHKIRVRTDDLTVEEVNLMLPKISEVFERTASSRNHLSNLVVRLMEVFEMNQSSIVQFKKFRMAKGFLNPFEVIQAVNNYVRVEEAAAEPEKFVDAEVVVASEPEPQLLPDLDTPQTLYPEWFARQKLSLRKQLEELYELKPALEEQGKTESLNHLVSVIEKARIIVTRRGLEEADRDALLEILRVDLDAVIVQTKADLKFGDALPATSVKPCKALVTPMANQVPA